MSAGVDLDNVCADFGTFRAVDNVAVNIQPGEFFSFLGPSGCGKTTILRMISGFISPSQGVIRIGGKDMKGQRPNQRPTALIFQNLALFPLMPVWENIAFGLEARGAPKAEIAATVKTFVTLVHMEALADRSVKALSGGQQQRVAVARALAVRPKLLLLDEPFSALDRKLRETMQIELKRLLRELGTTAVFVTHDQDEALAMSDRIAVMNRGRIEQLDTPTAIYARPATAFALEFVGLSTRLAGKVIGIEPDGVIVIDTAHGALRGHGAFAVGSPVVVGVRPERIAFGAREGANTIAVELMDMVFQGSRVQAHFVSPDDHPIMIESAGELPAGLAPGSPTPISWGIADTLIYPAAS